VQQQVAAPTPAPLPPPPPPGGGPTLLINLQQRGSDLQKTAKRGKPSDD
jgi:hypothetical protein